MRAATVSSSADVASTAEAMCVTESLLVASMTPPGGEGGAQSERRLPSRWPLWVEDALDLEQGVVAAGGRIAVGAAVEHLRLAELDHLALAELHKARDQRVGR